MASKAGALTCAFVMYAAGVSAQSVARFSVDSAIDVDHFVGENHAGRPNIVVDITASWRLANGWTAYMRPWFRQPRANRWDKEIYQAAVQYERSGRVATRMDLGYIVSPIGLGMLDTRPGLNPTILPHLSYLTPMPTFDAGAPRVPAIAATYPLGGQVTASTLKWDARAAVLAAPPNRIFIVNSPTPNPPARPFVVVGGGVTPRIGLRLGASFGAGEYAKASEIPRASEGRSLKMLSVEGEYAVGYSKFTAELTRDALETPIGSETAYAWFAQGMQTLAPRWFVAARQEGTSAPPVRTGVVAGTRTTLHVTEATVGFRVSPELTLRSSFVARKPFTQSNWDQQVGASIVWAHRWW